MKCFISLVALELTRDRFPLSLPPPPGIAFSVLDNSGDIAMLRKIINNKDNNNADDDNMNNNAGDADNDNDNITTIK